MTSDFNPRTSSGEGHLLSITEQVALAAAWRRIAALETEPAVTRRANELLKAQVVFPKGRSRLSVVVGRAYHLQTA